MSAPQAHCICCTLSTVRLCLISTAGATASEHRVNRHSAVSHMKSFLHRLSEQSISKAYKCIVLLSITLVLYVYAASALLDENRMSLNTTQACFYL